MTIDQQNTINSSASLIQRGDGLQVVVGLGKSGLATVNFFAQFGLQSCGNGRR